MGLQKFPRRASSRRPFVVLAPGVYLTRRRLQPLAMLQSTAGGAQLNESAATILELCDGSRTPDQLAAEAVLRCRGTLRAADVLAFLAASRARGWVVEAR